MSSFRATFHLQSIGYYPRGKAIYLTVTSITTTQDTTQKVSVLLDRTEHNLEKLGDIIREQKYTIVLTLDTSSRTFIPDKGGRDLVRFRAIKIEESCEPSNANFFNPISN